jgi:hypothetical protein
MREHIPPFGESGFQAQRAAMRFAKSCNSQRKKAPPGRYCVRPPYREVMSVTRTPKVMLAPDLGLEMRSSEGRNWSTIHILLSDLPQDLSATIHPHEFLQSTVRVFACRN